MLNRSCVTWQWKHRKSLNKRSCQMRDRTNCYPHIASYSLSVMWPQRTQFPFAKWHECRSLYLNCKGRRNNRHAICSLRNRRQRKYLFLCKRRKASRKCLYEVVDDLLSKLLSKRNEWRKQGNQRVFPWQTTRRFPVGKNNVKDLLKR